MMPNDDLDLFFGALKSAGSVESSHSGRVYLSITSEIVDEVPQNGGGGLVLVKGRPVGHG